MLDEIKQEFEKQKKRKIHQFPVILSDNSITQTYYEALKTMMIMLTNQFVK
jgi:hypothetical protein